MNILNLTIDSSSIDPDVLKRKRNWYNKQQELAKKDPKRIANRSKAKAARKARKK